LSSRRVEARLDHLAHGRGRSARQALAPCVIDTLNMSVQLPYQLKSWGKYSEMINDYTARDLVPMPDTPEARRLWMMVDPWMHRARVKQPTMIVNGTNDPYWTQDALNLYWTI